jgi:ornithine cyclodeaminase
MVINMKVLTLNDIEKLVKKHGFNQFLQDLMVTIKEDYSNWNNFDKSSRHAIHVDGGVIELMPVADDKLYTYKYVNGHPRNTKENKLTITATGQISSVYDGYPLMYSEMTLLTAFRTAATSAVATDLMSRKNSQTLCLIGTGAQSEFQLLANILIRDIKIVKYFDTDIKAMEKFTKNIKAKNLPIELVQCSNPKDAILGADIVISCIADKAHVNAVMSEWVLPGTHINGIGGDCPGKTELELALLPRTKIAVEYLPQTMVEGEIQRLNKSDVEKLVKAEFWELVTGNKTLRTSNEDITLFDSVGFALEDFSVLRLVYELALKYNLGHDLDIIPELSDTKNLISLLD